MALQTNHTTDGFHCRPGIAGRQNNPLKYTDPSEHVKLYSYWDGKSSGGHGSSPVLEMNPYFTMGGAGAIGPGSGKHWSDPYRGGFGNFMLMNSKNFDRYYGSGSYNRYLEDNGFLGKNGYWVTFIESFEESSFDGVNSKDNKLSGVEITKEFVEVATNGGGYYPEGSYSYDKTHIQYLPAEGIGLLGGWSNVRGNAKVYRGSDGKYYANVSATGYTPASTKGTVNFSGSVDVLSGNKVISSHSLHPFSGPSIIQSGRQDVGSAVFALPNVNNDVYLRFNVGYSYSEGVGYAVPIPGQGHYNIQIGFTIDAWTY